MRTWAELDRRLYQGQATVATVEEVQQLLQTLSLSEAVEQVDVVVTATFAPVSWAVLFSRLALPATVQWIEQAWLAGIPLQPGFHPREMALQAGATVSHSPPRGGAHLLEAWLSGERLPLKLRLRPGTLSMQSSWEGSIGLTDLESARLLVVVQSRVEGQVAVNNQSQPLSCELGLLFPEMGNAAHSWMGPWEPAALDAAGRSIAAGLPVLLAGSVGHVVWRHDHTIALTGDLHNARREYLRPLVIPGYGIGLSVGIAWPIAVLDAQTLAPLKDSETELCAQVLDYGAAQRPFPCLAQASYGDLSAGTISVAGRQVPVTPLSSTTRAARLAEDLKQRLLHREFPPLFPSAPKWTEEVTSP
jgi:uncharacterized protein (DUF39 family)